MRGPGTRLRSVGASDRHHVVCGADGVHDAVVGRFVAPGRLASADQTDWNPARFQRISPRNEAQLGCRFSRCPVTRVAPGSTEKSILSQASGTPTTAMVSPI